MFTLSQRMNDTAAVSGNEGIVYITYPDGRRKILANCLSFEFSQKFTSTTIPILGLRNKVNKKGLGECSGNIKMHYNCSDFREAVEEYKNTGKDSFYDLLIVNSDPNTPVGTQSVFIRGVNFTEMPIALLDTEADYLTETLPFTANGWDMNGKFNENGLRDA